jgi:hypothetical protein
MTSQADNPAPVPLSDRDSEFYWKGLADRQILAQRCDACERVRFPPMPTCPYCAARSATIVECPGTGAVYSYVVVHRAFDPAFADAVPYVVSTVDLDPGIRVVARFDGGRPAIGDHVTPAFVDHASWTELRFRAGAPTA